MERVGRCIRAACRRWGELEQMQVGTASLALSRLQGVAAPCVWGACQQAKPAVRGSRRRMVGKTGRAVSSHGRLTRASTPGWRSRCGCAAAPAEPAPRRRGRRWAARRPAWRQAHGRWLASWAPPPPAPPARGTTEAGGCMRELWCSERWRRPRATVGQPLWAGAAAAHAGTQAGRQQRPAHRGRLGSACRAPRLLVERGGLPLRRAKEWRPCADQTGEHGSQLG